MPNTDRLINHQDGLKIVTQLEEIASALGHSNKVTGVKGSSETNYRTGNVSISPSDLGLGHIQEDIDELANEKADAATTLAGYGITDSYTKSEVDNIVSEIETNTVWKEAVTNYSDIATTYPNPEEGWTVNVTSTNETYRFDGSEWVMINANAIPEATTSISGLMTSAHVIKLNGIEEGAEVNVQADWNQTNSSHDGFIKNKPSIPSKTSELINDSNFITNENLSVAAITGEFSDLQDIPTTISGYGISDAYTKDEVDNIVSTIESGVTWKEAVTNYSDIATTYPNPEEGWTVNVTSTNSTYRYNGTEWVLINTNVIPNATTSVNGLMTTTHVEKLNSIEASAQKNVQADWNEDDYVSDSYIKNKPTLGTAATKDSTSVIASESTDLIESGAVHTALTDKVDKITGKDLSTNDFTDALKDKLDDIEPNAEVNVQADWSETDTTDDAYIANKPTTVAGFGITDAYTKTEVDNLVSEVSTSMIWKAAVDTYADIATTYPSPSEGWTVNVTSTNRTYRYDGSEWVLINANTIPVASTTVDGLMGSAMVTKLNGIETGAEVNQNAFATVKVGNVNVSADAKDDTIELAADNVTITPDATNDKITLGLTDSNVKAALGFTPAEDAVMVGATASANGQKGLVPAPTYADRDKLLYGNGTWGAKPTYTPSEIGTYSDDEIDNMIASVQSDVEWKPAVATYADISTTYPNPEEGWTVNVTNANETYRYNGAEWVLINTNVIPTATTSVDGLMTSNMVVKLNGIETGAQVNVIPDWSQTNSAAADFIKNKPTLGTASAKDAPTSGDAASTQVVLGNDSRLSDARPASDVSAWAKAATKPTYTATEVGAIASTEKGVASGVAELDANGKVPSSQLPSYVDDVKEGYLNSADGKFYEESTYETEITPEADKIYVDKATNITYRWSGSAFVAIGSDLALGETSTTAYRGDRGKAAYDHATDANKISTATASGLYKVAATAEGHISDLTAVQKSDLTALGVADASNLGTAAAKDSTSTITSGSTDLIEGGAVYTALQGKANSADLGTAASKDSTTTIAQGSTDLPEAGAVYNTVDDLKNYLPQSYLDNWSSMSWEGLGELQGRYIWTDGDNIYYSYDSDQYVLNKSTSTWSAKTWSGLTSFNGDYIWTDGDNIYCSSYDSGQYVLNKSTSTWETKTWSGFTDLSGNFIWSDGDNIYYSDFLDQYVLNKSTSTWEPKTWSGTTDILGDLIWTDGDNIYYSVGTVHYVLNKSTSTWTRKTWSGLTSITSSEVWTDGDNIYYSYDSNQYVLNKSTSTWEPKTWSGLTNFNGTDVWSDGENIYYSSFNDSYQNFVLDKTTARCGNAAKKNVTTSVTSGSANLVTSGGVYTYVDTVITQALNGSY